MTLNEATGATGDLTTGSSIQEFRGVPRWVSWLNFQCCAFSAAGPPLSAAMVLTCFATAQGAQAALPINIDLSTPDDGRVQSDQGDYTWRVSTARSGYATPRGVYRSQRLEKMHYSRKYDMSPMPHSIFFKGGYAIHGTGAVGALGRPASHGCVRLSKANAAQLYAMVQRESAVIAITGVSPASAIAGKGGRTHVAGHKAHKTQTAAKRMAAEPLGYAPAPRSGSLKSWVRDPAEVVGPALLNSLSARRSSGACRPPFLPPELAVLGRVGLREGHRFAPVDEVAVLVDDDPHRRNRRAVVGASSARR